MPYEMFIEPDRDPRVDPPMQGDERTTLTAFLDWQRETLVLKCDGLDAADMARRSVEPSSMSLLGLVRHLAEVERVWFRRRLAGEDVPSLFPSDTQPDPAFDGAVADPDVVAEAWALWREEVAFSRRFAADASDLDITGDRRGKRVSLRWVLVHMVEEYARHLGHVDLIRERIDGAVGQ